MQDSDKSTFLWSIEESGDEFLNEDWRRNRFVGTRVRFMIGMNVNNCATSDGTTGAGTGGGTGSRSRGREGHSSNATLNSDGGRRQYNDQHQNNHFREQQPQKRQRSGQEQQQQQAMASVTSTMQSTATIIPPDNDHSNLKAKGHYSSSSSMELYFAWFSAITFIGELFIGKHWSYVHRYVGGGPEGQSQLIYSCSIVYYGGWQQKQRMLRLISMLHRLSISIGQQENYTKK